MEKKEVNLKESILLKSKINNSNIKSRSMKKLFQVIILLIMTQNLNAQNYTESVESRNQTTLLLDQLQVRVNEIKLVEDNLGNSNLNSNEIEQIKNQLSKLQKDMVIFLYHSLQERCTVERRLLEISRIVQPIDKKLAEKFVVLNAEQQVNR